MTIVWIKFLHIDTKILSIEYMRFQSKVANENSALSLQTIHIIKVLSSTILQYKHINLSGP